MNIILFAGEFKPPHEGDFNTLKEMFKQFDAEKAIVIIGNKELGGIHQDAAEDIWEIYREHFKKGIDIIKSPTTARQHAQNFINNEGGSFKVIYTPNDFIQGENVKHYKNKSSMEAKEIRQAIADKETQLFDYFPDELVDTEKEQIYAILGVQELAEAKKLFDDFDKLMELVEMDDREGAKKQMLYMKEMMGYPSAKEYKSYMGKLKKIRSYLNQDSGNRDWAEVPSYFSDRVKKMHESIEEAEDQEVAFQIDPEKIRVKDYIIRVLKRVFPKDFEYLLDKDKGLIMIKVPKKKAKSEFDPENPTAPKTKKEKTKPRDKFKAVQGLHWRTPNDARRAVEKLKNKNIPAGWKVRSLIPIMNRAESTIEAAKTVEKKRDLINGFKVIKKYYDALKRGDEQ